MNNNDELIAAGHELAKCLDNEPLVDIAKMIVLLADKLEVTTAALREKTKQCEAMAAENSAIKSLNDCLSEELRGYESDGVFEGPKMHLLWWKTETPATDAFLREVRAQGVEAFAAYCQKRHSEMMKTEPNEPAINQAIAATRRSGELALWFAAQMRQGGAA